MTKTRSGATVSFPASTGARSSRNLYTFVGPDGYEVKYLWHTLHGGLDEMNNTIALKDWFHSHRRGISVNLCQRGRLLREVLPSRRKS